MEVRTQNFSLGVRGADPEGIFMCVCVYIYIYRERERERERERQTDRQSLCLTLKLCHKNHVVSVTVT